MMLDKAAKEFEYDCKIRHLSPKTIDNYGKQLRYLQRFLEKEFSISSIEDVKPSHIKRFPELVIAESHLPLYNHLFFGAKPQLIIPDHLSIHKRKFTIGY